MSTKCNDSIKMPYSWNLIKSKEKERVRARTRNTHTNTERKIEIDICILYINRWSKRICVLGRWISHSHQPNIYICVTRISFLINITKCARHFRFIGSHNFVFSHLYNNNNDRLPFPFAMSAELYPWHLE